MSKTSSSNTSENNNETDKIKTQSKEEKRKKEQLKSKFEEIDIQKHEIKEGEIDGERVLFVVLGNEEFIYATKNNITGEITPKIEKWQSDNIEFIRKMKINIEENKNLLEKLEKENKEENNIEIERLKNKITISELELSSGKYNIQDKDMIKKIKEKKEREKKLKKITTMESMKERGISRTIKDKVGMTYVSEKISVVKTLKSKAISKAKQAIDFMTPGVSLAMNKAKKVGNDLRRTIGF